MAIDREAQIRMRIAVEGGTDARKELSAVRAELMQFRRDISQMRGDAARTFRGDAYQRATRPDLITGPGQGSFLKSELDRAEKLLSLVKQINSQQRDFGRGGNVRSGPVQDVRVINFMDMNIAAAGASLAGLGIQGAPAGSGYGGAGANYSMDRSQVGRDQQRYAQRRMAEGASAQQVAAEVQQRYGVGGSRGAQVAREAARAAAPPPPPPAMSSPGGTMTAQMATAAAAPPPPPPAMEAPVTTSAQSRPAESAEDAVRRLMGQGDASSKNYRRSVRDQVKARYNLSRQAADAVLGRAGFPIGEAPNMAMGGMFHAPHMAGGGSFHERMQSVVSGSFPGAKLSGRLATVMGAEGRDIQILGHEALNALQVDFGWSGESGDAKTSKTKKGLDPSSLRFLDSLEAMINRAKQEGLGIKFKAEPRRTSLYEKILAANGFEKAGEGLWMPGSGAHMATGGRFSKLGAMLGGYAGHMIDVPMGWLGGGLQWAGAGMMGLGAWMQGGESGSTPRPDRPAGHGRKGAKERNLDMIREMMEKGMTPEDIRKVMQEKAGISGSTADAYRRAVAKQGIVGPDWFEDLDFSRMDPDTGMTGTTPGTMAGGPQQCPVCGATNPKGANYCHQCGYVKHFAKGGRADMTRGGVVPMMAGVQPGSDWHPAWLTNDEYVINARSARKHKSLLDAVNADHAAGGGMMGPDGLMHYALGGRVAAARARRQREREEEAEEVEQAYERMYGGRNSRIGDMAGYGGARIAGAAGAGHLAQLFGAGGDIATAAAAGGPAGIAVAGAVAGLKAFEAGLEKTTAALEIMQSPFMTAAQRSRAMAEEFIPLADKVHRLVDAIDGVNRRVELAQVGLQRDLAREHARQFGAMQMMPLHHQANQYRAAAVGMHAYSLQSGQVAFANTAHGDILAQEQDIRLAAQDALVGARRSRAGAEDYLRRQSTRTIAARAVAARDEAARVRAERASRAAVERENRPSTWRTPLTRGEGALSWILPGGPTAFMARNAFGYGPRDQAGRAEASRREIATLTAASNSSQRLMQEETEQSRAQLELARQRTEEQRRMIGLMQGELQIMQQRSQRMRDDVMRLGSMGRGERHQAEIALDFVRHGGVEGLDLLPPELVQRAGRIAPREIADMQRALGEQVARDYAARGLMDARGLQDWQNGNAQLGDTLTQERTLAQTIRERLDQVAVHSADQIASAFDSSMQRLGTVITRAMQQMVARFEAQLREQNNHRR